jgi:hypothetical protein
MVWHRFSLRILSVGPTCSITIAPQSSSLRVGAARTTSTSAVRPDVVSISTEPAIVEISMREPEARLKLLAIRSCSGYAVSAALFAGSGGQNQGGSEEQGRRVSHRGALRASSTLGEAFG